MVLNKEWKHAHEEKIRENRVSILTGENLPPVVTMHNYVHKHNQNFIHVMTDAIEKKAIR